MLALKKGHTHVLAGCENVDDAVVAVHDADHAPVHLRIALHNRALVDVCNNCRPTSHR